MTLGEYPGSVDPKFRSRLAPFLKVPEFDIGKFRDVGHLVGVNRFNHAGGAVMDDFDDDGLLDLAMSSFDPPKPWPSTATRVMRPSRTGRIGRGQNQFGGLVCYQTDYDNDGRMDIFIPRGAWLPSPDPADPAAEQWRRSNLPMSRREAGLLDPVNSNSAAWADYDNDGWLDLFMAVRNRPTGSITTGVTGRSRKSPPRLGSRTMKA